MTFIDSRDRDKENNDFHAFGYVISENSLADYWVFSLTFLVKRYPGYLKKYPRPSKDYPQLSALNKKVDSTTRTPETT